MSRAELSPGAAGRASIVVGEGDLAFRDLLDRVSAGLPFQARAARAKTHLCVTGSRGAVKEGVGGRRGRRDHLLSPDGPGRVLCADHRPRKDAARMQEPKPPAFHYAWVIVLGGTLTTFAALGLGRFALGMLLPAMSAELGLGYARMGWIGTANFPPHARTMAICSMISSFRFQGRIRT